MLPKIHRSLGSIFFLWENTGFTGRASNYDVVIRGGISNAWKSNKYSFIKINSVEQIEDGLPGSAITLDLRIVQNAVWEWGGYHPSFFLMVLNLLIGSESPVHSFSFLRLRKESKYDESHNLGTCSSDKNFYKYFQILVTGGKDHVHPIN